MSVYDCVHVCVFVKANTQDNSLRVHENTCQYGGVFVGIFERDN